MTLWLKSLFIKWVSEWIYLWEINKCEFHSHCEIIKRSEGGKSELTFHFTDEGEEESSRRSIFPKEVKFQVRVWRRRFQILACTVPKVYGLHLLQVYGCIDCSVRLLQNWHELRGGSTARTARIPRCTDLYGAFNSAQIPRCTDSVRLGKFGTNFEVFYCCINYCTAALNSGTCPEICTAVVWFGTEIEEQYG